MATEHSLGEQVVDQLLRRVVVQVEVARHVFRQEIDQVHVHILAIPSLENVLVRLRE